MDDGPRRISSQDWESSDFDEPPTTPHASGSSPDPKGAPEEVGEGAKEETPKKEEAQGSQDPDPEPAASFARIRRGTMSMQQFLDRYRFLPRFPLERNPYPSPGDTLEVMIRALEHHLQKVTILQSVSKKTGRATLSYENILGLSSGTIDHSSGSQVLLTYSSTHLVLGFYNDFFHRKGELTLDPLSSLDLEYVPGLLRRKRFLKEETPFLETFPYPGNRIRDQYGYAQRLPWSVVVCRLPFKMELDEWGTDLSERCQENFLLPQILLNPVDIPRHFLDLMHTSKDRFFNQECDLYYHPIAPQPFLFTYHRH